MRRILANGPVLTGSRHQADTCRASDFFMEAPGRRPQRPALVGERLTNFDPLDSTTLNQAHQLRLPTLLWRVLRSQRKTRQPRWALDLRPDAAAARVRRPPSSTGMG